eukprot:1271057-Karenia_brevis.AAC.1
MDMMMMMVMMMPTYVRNGNSNANDDDPPCPCFASPLRTYVDVCTYIRIREAFFAQGNRPMWANIAGRLVKGVSRVQYLYILGEEPLIAPEMDCYKEVLKSEGMMHIGTLLVHGAEVLGQEQVTWILSCTPEDMCAHPYLAALKVPELALNDDYKD